MKFEPFFEKFDFFADAPDAVTKIRQLVLELALNGSVVGLDSKKWERVTLGSLGDWGSGGTPLRSEPRYYGGSIPWLVIGDLNDGIVTSASTFITEEGLANSSARLLPKGVLLIAMYGSIGKMGITGIECATNQAIAFCKPHADRVDLRYLFYTLKGIQPTLLARGQGLAQKNISQTILKAWGVFLPPLAEQKRIVAKVDELMALCDQLEALEREREMQHAALTRASLIRFAESPTPASLESIFHDAYAVSITGLRKTILNLAIRGKLVDQSKGENVNALVQLAKRAKNNLRAGTWMSSEMMAAPFDIPDTWAWLCIGDAVRMTNGRAFKSSEWSGAGLPIVRIQNLNNEDAGFNYYSGEYDERHKIENGSFLISWSGTPGTSFGAFIWNRGDALLNQHIFKCELHAEIFESKYLLLAINARLDEMVAHAQGGAGLRHITKGKLESICIPLPPLGEQRRIVAKVDNLMTLVKALGTQLDTARSTAANLLMAAVLELTTVAKEGGDAT